MILDSLTESAPAQLIGLGLAISPTVILARIVWVYPATYLPRWASTKLRRGPYPPAGGVRHLLGGMRGVVSLAAALALPSSTSRIARC